LQKQERIMQKQEKIMKKRENLKKIKQKLKELVSGTIFWVFVRTENILFSML
jgi:hypothetical protein